MNHILKEYLSPTNPIASGITSFLNVFFVLWIAGLIVYGIWLYFVWKQIKKNENVDPLINVDKTEVGENEGDDNKKFADSTFRNYCKKRTLNEQASVTKHLKTIFLAGWNESRLETSELINNTSSNLFKWNGIFRSVLAVFIVIGLLGTLFGLTDSLTQLSPALEAGVTEDASADNNEKMTKALSLLLGEMKSAFAPSILGIFFTIIGIIIYNAFLQIVCQPIKSTLERLTLTVWIPQLYPTTSQRLIQTLQESEAQMRSGYETAKRVGDLVGNIQGNISEFDKNLQRANAVTEPLNEAVTQVKETANTLKVFSDKFTEDVTRITGFQDEIRNIHKGFQNVVNEKLKSQNQNISETLTALNKTITSHHQIDDGLKKLLESIQTQNAPIKDAAEQMRGLYQNMIEKTNNTIGTLQVELRTQNNRYADQLQAVRELSQGILLLLDKLEKRIDATTVRSVTIANPIEQTESSYAKTEKISPIKRITKFFSRK